MDDHPSFYDTRLKPDTAALIGELIIAWGTIEMCLALVLNELVLGRAIPLNDEMTSFLAFVGQTPKVQIGLLKTMAGMRFSKTRAKEFCSILDKLSGIKKMRDRIAHGYVLQHPKGSGIQVTELKTVGKVSMVRIPYSDKIILENRALLQQHWQELLTILTEYGYMKHWHALLGKVNGRKLGGG